MTAGESASARVGKLERRSGGRLLGKQRCVARILLTLLVAPQGARAECLRAPNARAAASDDTPQAPLGSVPAESARVLFDEARSAYEQGRYADALTLLEQAQARDPRPLFLFDIAQALRKLGRCSEARRMYQSYLAQDITGASRATAAHHLEALGTCPEEQAQAVPHDTPPAVGAPLRARTPRARSSCLRSTWPAEHTEQQSRRAHGSSHEASASPLGRCSARAR